jgi:acetyl-CoA C-acetyltransferase
MGTAVLVEAIRTPIGRRDGALSRLKPVELLSRVLVELVSRAGIEPGEVQQIIGGCVTQIGEQGLNVTRNGWLLTGLDPEVACTTVDVSCGSSQQANHLVVALIDAGRIDVGIACGVEAMSRVPLGANVPNGHEAYKTDAYPWDDPPHLQFGGAERIASREQFTRRDLDDYGLASQRRAEAAWADGRFEREVVPVTAPVAGAAGEQHSRLVTRDEGLRETSLEALAALRPAMRGGLHTAGTISQVSDGATALLWMSQAKAKALGLRPRARLLDQVVTGADPYYLLDGPIVATRKVLARTGTAISDFAVCEVNEAFASVVLSWARAHKADLERTNPNGGAIALGHPVGATGGRLLMTALHELERIDGELALVAMCCGGSMGTAAVVERL